MHSLAKGLCRYRMSFRKYLAPLLVDQEILSGLKAGEAVVLTGHSKLQEGARVRLQSTLAVTTRLE